MLIYDCAVYDANYYSRDAVLGSLFDFTLKPTIVLIIGHFLTSVKFRDILWQHKIPRKRANSAAWLKILQPAENWALEITIKCTVCPGERNGNGFTRTAVTG